MIPVVLLPGMMCDARLFGPQIESLSGRYPIHLAPIVAHDSVQALAHEVLRHAPPRFALAGLSMGGIVAMEILAQAPERVERIALLDTNPNAELQEVRTGREPQIDKVRRGGLRAVMREEMKPRYLADSPRRQEILDLCMEMAVDLGSEVFIRQSRALQNRPDQRETLARAKLPALLLCGEGDVLCPVERHLMMQELIEGSRLEIVPGASHLPTLEQPEITTAALARWLSE